MNGRVLLMTPVQSQCRTGAALRAPTQSDSGDGETSPEIQTYEELPLAPVLLRTLWVRLCISMAPNVTTESKFSHITATPPTPGAVALISEKLLWNSPAGSALDPHDFK